MDPKETSPETQGNAGGVPNVSELFAQTDSIPTVPTDSPVQDIEIPTPPLLETPILETPSSDIPSVAQEFAAPIEDVTTNLDKEETKITMDPKLLASNLEEKWSDETIPSQQSFQKQVAQATETNKPEPQVVEKIVYQKQRVHGFFRTLTLIALLVVGVLMLLEELKIFALHLDWMNMNLFYPIFVILSVIVIWSYKGIFGKIFGLLMFLSVVGGSFILGVYSSLNPSTNNATGTTYQALFPDTPYSKIYISTVLDSLSIDGNGSGVNTVNLSYDIGRPLHILSGSVQSGHDYLMVQESDNINLLQGVYSTLHLGLQDTQPLYLYLKTFLGQNNLDLTHLNVHGLRIHGGVMALDVLMGNNDTIVPQPMTGAVAKTGIKLQTGMNTLAPISGKVVHTQLDLQAAVADVTLHIPQDMGVRMYYKSYLGKIDAPTLSPNTDGVYETMNISSAKKILTINALFGLSRLTILQDR